MEIEYKNELNTSNNNNRDIEQIIESKYQDYLITLDNYMELPRYIYNKYTHVYDICYNNNNNEKLSIIGDPSDKIQMLLNRY